MTITEIDEKFMREALAEARRRGGGRGVHRSRSGARGRDCRAGA